MPPGRPRLVLDTPRPMEVRLTPSDGKPIDFEDQELKTLCSRFAAFEEGGADTGPKLHYHCLFETVYTQPVMMKCLNRLVRSDAMDPTKKGNAVVGAYRSQHEGSIGYAVKCGKCVYKHGYDDLWLAESIAVNNAYLRQKEKDKKAKQRNNHEFQQQLIEFMIKTQPDAIPAAQNLVQKILEQQQEFNTPFPTKSAMESLVNRIRWTAGQKSSVVAQYARHLDSEWR